MCAWRAFIKPSLIIQMLRKSTAVKCQGENEQYFSTPKAMQKISVLKRHLKFFEN